MTQTVERLHYPAGNKETGRRYVDAEQTKGGKPYELKVKKSDSNSPSGLGVPDRTFLQAGGGVFTNRPSLPKKEPSVQPSSAAVLLREIVQQKAAPGDITEVYSPPSHP